MADTIGYVSSVQSLGAVDGPGIRYVLFMQGCPLRCKCCHNPETWETGKGTRYTVDDVMQRLSRYVSYFGEKGGVTLSGGEPLLQTEFATELFSRCKSEGISTCLDTSGCVLDDKVEKLLSLCDTVLLDYKMTNEKDYFEFSKMHMSQADRFLQKLDDLKVTTWLRQVIVPDINDNEQSVTRLFELKQKYPCIEKIELLPFHKACITKYEKLGIEFPLKNTPEAKKSDVSELFEKISKKFRKGY